MPRLLLISPHFPPDTEAATHRARIVAPHLQAFGWETVVLTVDPRDYESRLDDELAAMVPETLRVVRVRAWPSKWTRRVGFGDLGLRGLMNLYRESCRLLGAEKFDVVLITIFPSYPAILGRLLRSRFGVPYIIDYQDPWVGEWGKSVGGGRNGQPTMRNRMSRWIAALLEPVAIRSAAALVAVSDATLASVVERNAHLRKVPRLELPIGAEPNDSKYLRQWPRSNKVFDRSDGNVHVVYVGTLLPLGFETLRAVLRAVTDLRRNRPDLYSRLRLHFIGTSNQTAADAPQRVMPLAAEFGVTDVVAEIPARVNYLDALTIQSESSAILMMGSSERHYTASKVYPGLIAGRPIIAVYHASSTVVAILRDVTPKEFIMSVTYDDDVRAEARAAEIEQCFVRLFALDRDRHISFDTQGFSHYSAVSIAGRLARLLDQVHDGLGAANSASAIGD